ncbi:MAG: hypothetical protein RLZZ350_175 [Verrucomicrobiota bacterium]|jgi:uncharacterized membrane protein
MTDQSLPIRWRKNFFAGLFLVLPAVISLAVIKWLFGTISAVTDLLLFFVPHQYTHAPLNGEIGAGPMYWYWSLAALVVGVLLISAVGRLARNYVGKKTIEWVENVMMRIPLFNKIYGSIKQVNDAFTVGGANSFKTVVLVEYPRAGVYSLGFLTSETASEAHAKTGEKLVCVFIPTTPNPTSGFLILVPDAQVQRLEMSVADGVKYIVSLGSIAPAEKKD